MTEITIPEDSTLYLEALKINGGAGAPASLADGELYIDEDGRRLYTKSASGIAGTPLDVMGLPLTRGVPNDAVLLKTEDFAEWGVLSAGAGGAVFDSETWRIPGIAPAAVSSKTFPAASGGSATFFLNHPRTLSNTRVRALSGTGNLTIDVNAANGANYFSRTYAIAGAGVYTFSPNLALPAGIYSIVYTSTATLVIETVDGYLAWTPALQSFPVSMQVI